MLTVKHETDGELMKLTTMIYDLLNSKVINQRLDPTCFKTRGAYVSHGDGSTPQMSTGLTLPEKGDQDLKAVFIDHMQRES